MSRIGFGSFDKPYVQRRGEITLEKIAPSAELERRHHFQNRHLAFHFGEQAQHLL